MITVTYYPTDGDVTTSKAATLADWFVSQFGDQMTLPDGLRITHGSATRENDVTDSIACGDPDGYLNRITGEYHVVEVPGTFETWIPVIIALVVSVASVLLTPKPNIPSSANRRQDSATNSLGNRSNEARPGERYQDVRGFEPAIYADLLMTPHRRYENNREVEYIYGTATTGKGLISDPRDGVTPISSIVNAQFNAYWPGTSPNSGSPVFQVGGLIDFPVVAAEKSRNVTGQELSPPNELDTGTLKWSSSSSGILTVIDPPSDLDLRNSYEVGEYVDLVDWYSFEYEETYVNDGSDLEYDLYKRHSTSGRYQITTVWEDYLIIDVSSNANWTHYGTGFDPFTMRTVQYRFDLDTSLWYIDLEEEPVGYLFETFNYRPALKGFYDGTVGPFRLPDDTKSGWVNLVARQGIYKASQSDYEYSASFQFKLYEVDSAGNRTGATTTLPTITMSSNPILISDQVGTTADFTVPYKFCEIEGKRTTDTDKDFEGTVVDEVLWAELYTVEKGLDFTAAEDCTTVYAKIQQNPTALAVQERKLNFGLTRYERAYLGNGAMSSSDDTPSDEFADAVVGLALDPYVGKNVTLEQLNIDELYAVQEEIVEYFGTREAVKFGYSFSTTEMTFEDHLTLIAQAVFCRVFRVGNTYEFRFDRPRAIGERALMLNHRFKYAKTDKRNRKFTDSDGKGYDGVVVSYKDKDSLSFEYIRIPEGTYPVNALEIELSGVIYPQVAKWVALREWNKIRYKRVYHETEAHSMARGLVPGDRIVMANDTLTRSRNGQVLEQSGLDLRLATGVGVEEGVEYSITLLYKSGTVENILCESSPIGENWVRLYALPSEELYTGNLEWRTGYNLYESSEADKDDMLVESMTVSIKNGQERVKVQAVNYDPRYWQDDPQIVSTGSFSTDFSDDFDKGYNT